MANDDRKLSITYSSGLIPPPEHMSTLAVLYDEIWLPCPYELGVESGKGLIDPFFNVKLSTSEFTTYGSSNKSFKVNASISNSAISLYRYTQWKSKINVLCDAGIICTLPPLSRKQLEFNNIVSKLRENPQTNVDYRENRHIISIIYEEYVLVLHKFFSDKPSPELFISNPSDTRTTRLAGFLADAIFQLKIPQLKTLNAEQILEVRYKLRNFKEGFTDYVIRLTNDVEALLRSGETSELVATQKIAERYFETEYNQIRRQIEPLKIMSGGSILAASGVFRVPPAAVCNV